MGRTAMTEKRTRAERTRLALRSACAIITVFALSALSLDVARATPDNAPTADSIIEDDESLLTFIQDEPLTSTEHDRIATKIRDGLQRDPGPMQHVDTVVRNLLVKLPNLDELTTEAVREELRVRFAMLPDSVLERQILEKHDPAVALDRNHGSAVTARTIVIIRRASQWMAKQIGVAEPVDGFLQSETAYLRANFSRFSTDDQDACTHIARNMSASIALFIA